MFRRSSSHLVQAFWLVLPWSAAGPVAGRKGSCPGALKSGLPPKRGFSSQEEKGWRWGDKLQHRFPSLLPCLSDSWLCGLRKKSNHTLLWIEDPVARILSFANVNQQLGFLRLWLCYSCGSREGESVPLLDSFALSYSAVVSNVRMKLPLEPWHAAVCGAAESQARLNN